MSLNAFDAQCMATAIRLAERGLYTTSPNPRVGCVIVDAKGVEVGRGWHKKAGGPHAEIEALTDAGSAAQGATCYVTLEPCNHQGRTGACTEALIAAGVHRVVYAHEDPNPRVAGAGIARLREAGIHVDGPLLDQEARKLNPGFIKRMTRGLPWIRIKMAMSMDGRTAMADGQSFWITGPCARADVQRLRGRSCAIITGHKTLTQDQASLTVRPQEFGLQEEGLGERQPLRVVVESRGEMDASLPFFKTPNTLVATATPVQRRIAGAEFIHLPNDQGQVDLEALLRWLAGKRECNEVLIESGAVLAGAFLKLGLVDELIVYVAPKLMGSEARPLFQLPYQFMDQSLPIRFVDCRSIGRDLRITAIPEIE